MDPYGHLVLNAEGTTQMGVLWQWAGYISSCILTPVDKPGMGSWAGAL